MTFACDGEPSRFTTLWKATFDNARKLNRIQDIVVSPDRDQVFQRIHGRNASLPQLAEIGGRSKWNTAYTNLDAAFIDAKECIQIYYDRCLGKPSITFKCGNAVDHIRILNNQAKGVVLENGTIISADLVVVAAGAWSNKLVQLGERLIPIGHEVAWIKVTPEEENRWRTMSITTNLSTGLNMFPPYKGEIKILRRSPGYKNTVTVPHPEDRSKETQITYPRTIVSDPSDIIPADAEAAMRDNLREIMPELASRPFDRTKICW